MAIRKENLQCDVRNEMVNRQFLPLSLCALSDLWPLKRFPSSVHCTPAVAFVNKMSTFPLSPDKRTAVENIW